VVEKNDADVELLNLKLRRSWV